MRRFTYFIATAVIIIGISAALVISRRHRSHKAGVESTESLRRLPRADDKGTKNDIPFSGVRFPDGFIWGVATSFFQNEGGRGLTDWEHWEEYAKRNPESVYPGFSEQDILLAESLGIKSIRFSMEWACIEPQEGTWDNARLARYVQFASFMIKHGIKPFPNFSHFTLPYWMAKAGGWENDKAPIWFGDYVRHVAKVFRPLGIEFWMTFNEPTVTIVDGYIKGRYPPLKRGDLEAAKRARRNLINAHRLAYSELHDVLDSPTSKIKVGIAHYTSYFEPADPESKEDRGIVTILDFMLNTEFLDAIQDRIDYVGINYYARAVVRLSYLNAATLRSPVEWVRLPDGRPNIYPPGIYELVKEFRVYGKPIIITENGLDDMNDTTRQLFIASHLAWLNKAISEKENEGAPVIGYFHWTLFDNKEWVEPEPHYYGLVAVRQGDPKKTRIPRQSAYFFRDVIRANGITEEIVEKYLPKTKK